MKICSSFFVIIISGIKKPDIGNALKAQEKSAEVKSLFPL